MKPAIEAAWIAAGSGLLGVIVGITGTVVIAIVSFRSTGAATDKTIKAGTDNTIRALDASRDDRLWDKRAATYAETAAYLLFQRDRREYRTRIYRAGQAAEDLLKDEMFGGYKPPGSFEIHGRLAACGSRTIITAYEAAHAAHQEAARLFAQWSDLLQSSDNSRAIEKAHEAFNAARDRTDHTAQAVIDLINDELTSKPSQVAPSARDPAVRATMNG
jgi:hypothetical protein